MNMKKLFTFCFCLILSSMGFATNLTLQKSLQKLGLENVEISASPLSELRIATTDMGIFYISQDGKYLIEGKMYKITPNGILNLTTQSLIKKLNSYAKEMIVFPAKHQKYVVNVFLDISCHFCHKMFAQNKAYNDLGITIRYLAFPRNGLDSLLAQQMEAIWQAPNPMDALTQAETHKIFPEQMQSPKIVKKQFDLGVQFGIQGTPAIVLSNGQVIAGYIPPQELLKILQQTN